MTRVGVHLMVKLSARGWSKTYLQGYEVHVDEACNFIVRIRNRIHLFAADSVRIEKLGKDGLAFIGRLPERCFHVRFPYDHIPHAILQI